MKVKAIQKSIVLGMALALSTAIFAQEEEKPDGLFVKNLSNGATLKLGGYVDGYYQYNGNKPSNTGNQNTETTGRIFDTKHNEFSIGLAQTKFEYGTDKFQTVVDLTFGPNAESGNFGNLSAAGASTTATAIKQAYVSAELIDGLTLTAGQFGTHVGYEIIEAYANANYSLSNLFGFGPFYHQGVKLDYAVSDAIGVMVGVANGWDSTNTADNNNAKSALAQVSLVDLVPGLSVYLNYVGGAEQAGSETKMRHIGDITASMGISDQLSLGLNAAYGTDYKNLNATNESNEAWYGAALYIDFTLNPGEETTHMISTRAEYFNDNTTVRGHNGRVLGITGTYTLSMYGGAFMIKPELRYDLDLGKSGYYTRGANSQTTAMVAFIGTY